VKGNKIPIGFALCRGRGRFRRGTKIIDKQKKKKKDGKEKREIFPKIKERGKAKHIGGTFGLIGIEKKK